MDGFALLVGHLLGDYVLQNDWMAGNKANPSPGPRPDPKSNYAFYQQLHYQRDVVINWEARVRAHRRGFWACTIHCLLYTFAVWACSSWWMPWWGVLACFLVHWPIDRYRLAVWWMKNAAGQGYFASKDHPMFPWSTVAVDNTFHLATLLAIWIFHTRVFC